MALIFLAAILDFLRQEGDSDTIVYEELFNRPLAGHAIFFQAQERDRIFMGIHRYVADVVRNYPDPLFKRHFRMSRRAFQVTVIAVLKLILIA